MTGVLNRITHYVKDTMSFFTLKYQEMTISFKALEEAYLKSRYGSTRSLGYVR